MDHWLLEGLLRPNIVAEESEDGESEESSTEEVDFEARVSELEEELQYLSLIHISEPTRPY